MIAVAESWKAHIAILGAAVVVSVGAIAFAFWYHERKADAREHQLVLDAIADNQHLIMSVVAELRDGHRQIVATHQQITQRPYDWNAYTDGVRDAWPTTDGPPTRVICIKPRNNLNSE